MDNESEIEKLQKQIEFLISEIQLLRAEVTATRAQVAALPYVQPYPPSPWIWRPITWSGTAAGNYAIR